jgi:hypothetical protein
MCKELFSPHSGFFRCHNGGDTDEWDLRELPFSLSLPDTLILPAYLLKNLIQFLSTLTRRPAISAETQDSFSRKKQRTFPIPKPETDSIGPFQGACDR